MALCLRKQLVVDPDVAVGRSAHEHLFLAVVHFLHVVFVDLPVVRSTKDFKAESVVGSFVFNALRQQVNNYVGLTYIDKHVVTEDYATGWRHLHVVYKVAKCLR